MKSYEEFVIFHQNVRSLRKSLNEICVLAKLHKCSVLCISEHWLAEYQISLLNINNYKLVSHYCRSLNKHGGVAIYFLEGIEASAREDINRLSVSGVFECAASDFKSPSSVKITIVSVYHPPGSEIDYFFSRLEELMNILLYNGEIYFIVGDFNIDISKNTNNAIYFKNLVASYGCYFMVEEHTRVTVNSATCLDNVITNYENATCKVLKTGLSDHFG